MNTNFKIINAVVFQIGWFICILTNNVISLVFTFVFVTFNLLALYFSNKKLSLKTEISWLTVCLALGFLCETAFFSSGILYHTDSSSRLLINWPMLPPIWLLCLWILFAVTMRTSLTFIFNKPLLTSLLTLAIAPCNYYAGANLNSQVDMGQPLILNLVLIGITWLAIMGCLLTIHHRHFKDA